MVPRRFTVFLGGLTVFGRAAGVRVGLVQRRRPVVGFSRRLVGLGRGLVGLRRGIDRLGRRLPGPFQRFAGPMDLPGVRSAQRFPTGGGRPAAPIQFLEPFPQLLGPMFGSRPMTLVAVGGILTHTADRTKSGPGRARKIAPRFDPSGITPVPNEGCKAT